MTQGQEWSEFGRGRRASRANKRDLLHGAESGSGEEPSLPLKSAVHPEHFGLVQGARPVRSRPKRGLTSSWDGHFASSKAYGPTPFESLLERDFQTLISADPRIKRYAAQPHRLTYWAPDRLGQPMKRTYTPDYIALDQSGRMLIMEVKAKCFARTDKWTSLEPHIRHAYINDHDATFLLFTEDQIRVQPRLNNYRIMLSHRAPPDDVEADAVMRRLVAGITGALFLGQICMAAEVQGIDTRRGFSALMRLAIEGVVSLDQSAPLSMTTLVTMGLSQ